MSQPSKEIGRRQQIESRKQLEKLRQSQLNQIAYALKIDLKGVGSKRRTAAAVWRGITEKGHARGERLTLVIYSKDDLSVTWQEPDYPIGPTAPAAATKEQSKRRTKAQEPSPKGRR